MAAEGLRHAFALPTTDGGVGRVSGVVRPPLQRTIRHAQLSDQIRAVQAASQGTYRARSVHADLTPGVGLLGGPPPGGHADGRGRDRTAAKDESLQRLRTTFCRVSFPMAKSQP